MTRIFKTIPLACTLALLTSAAIIPASARPAVSIDFGNIAVGYRDGYQDNHHQWHRWNHRSDSVAYRSHYQQNYRDMNFRDDHNHGR
jgi:hypothetical protein